MKISHLLYSFTSILWIIPFFCFLIGYYTLDRFLRSEELETPSLIGLNMHQAISILASKNLNLRFLATKEDSMLEPGIIISQSPNTGQKIKENQSVYVVIVTKPKNLKAPTLINKSLHEIQAELNPQKINAKYCYLSSPYPKNTCFAQHPTPDTELDDSNKMIVYISQGSSKPLIMPDFKGKKVIEVTDYLATQSAKVDLFHYPPIQDHMCECIITDQRPMAGSILTINSDKPLHIQLQARPT